MATSKAKAQPTTPPPPPVEAPKPQKPEWHCEIKRDLKDEKPLTVGDEFELDCTGPQLTLKYPVQIKLPEERQYALHILKKNVLSADGTDPNLVTNTHISFTTTSYRAGQHKFSYLDIEDANGQGFVTQPIEFSVTSVLPNPPPQSIYGGVAPMFMGIPWWIPFTILIVIVVLLGWIALFFKKRIERKNLEANIRKFQSPMGSFHQFSKDVRKLRNSAVFSERHQWAAPQLQNYIFTLDELFRMFLLREFIVPATTWTSRQTLSAVKKKSKTTYRFFGDSLRKTMQELDRARSNYESMTSRDCDQLTQIVTKCVDTVWSYKHKGTKT